MLLCDRCVKNDATCNLKLTDASGNIVYHRWALCAGCLNFVASEAQKSVENYCPPELREFCPSLTPDQRKQVEQYIASRNKEPKQ